MVVGSIAFRVTTLLVWPLYVMVDTSPDVLAVAVTVTLVTPAATESV